MAAVRVAGGQLRVFSGGVRLELLPDALVPLALSMAFPDLFLDRPLPVRITVGTCEFLPVLFEFSVYVFDVPCDLLEVVVVLLAVLRTQFGGVARYQCGAYQVMVAGDLDTGPEDPLDGGGIVLPGPCDGIVVGPQVAQQPDKLYVAGAFQLKAAGRAHAVQVPVDVELEQVRGVVGRSALVGMGAKPSLFMSSESTNRSIDRTAFPGPIISSRQVV